MSTVSLPSLSTGPAATERVPAVGLVGAIGPVGPFGSETAASAVPEHRTGSAGQGLGGALTGRIEPEHAAPTDFHQVMNTVIHHALRRDLRRLGEILLDPIAFRRRDALVDQVRFLLDQLHHHHTVEDELIWPAVLTVDPSLQDLSAQMEAEHDRLDWVIERLTNAIADWAAKGDAGHRSAVRVAAIDLDTVLEPHLRHEEEVGMPAIVATLSAEDWRPIDRKIRSTRSPAALARQLYWMLDDLDTARTAALLTEFPRPLVRALRVLFGRRETKRAKLLWG